VIDGRARVFGDDINTDYVISSRRKRDSLDPAVLRQFLFEDVDPNFAASLEPGDLIVAGKNFGCGSAMEIAASVLLGVGMKAVLARSFARTYFRNAVNNGLLPVTCDTREIHEFDRIVVEYPTAPIPELPTQCEIAVRNQTTGKVIPAEPLSKLLVAILQAGGLAPFFKQHGGFGLVPNL
jgi:3-isopropylmalate/(R)-2-methylmalate dehydratase small subunit